MKAFFRCLLCFVGSMLACISFVSCADDICRHTYDVYREVKPTCTDAGYYAYPCTLCGEEYILHAASDDRAMQPTGHFAGERQGTTAPTCTNEGAYASVCADCGATLDQASLPTTEHCFDAASYTDQGGTHTATCSVCGFVSDSEACRYEISAVDEDTHATACVLCRGMKEGALPQTHVFMPSVVVEGSTCLTIGYKVKTCRDCGYEHRTVLPADGHEYEYAVSAEASQGHSLVCSLCGDVSDEGIAPHALTAKVQNGTVMLHCGLCEYAFASSYGCYADGVESSALMGSISNYGFGNGADQMPQVKKGAYVFEKNATTASSQAQLYMRCDELTALKNTQLPATRAYAFVSIRLKQGENTPFPGWGLRIINEGAGASWGAHETGTSKSIHVLDQKSVDGAPALVDANGGFLADFSAGSDWVQVDVRMEFLHAQDKILLTYFVDGEQVREVTVNNTLNNNNPHGLYFSAGGVAYQAASATQATLYMDDIIFAVFDT